MIRLPWTGAVLLLLAPILRAQEDDAAVRAWIEQLSSPYEEERLEAGRRLEGAGPAAEEALLGALAGGPHHVRRICLGLLARLKSARAAGPAGVIFRDGKEQRAVRQAAFDLLRSVPREAEDLLIEALESDDPAWRLGALEALRDSRSQKCAGKVAELYDREADPGIKEAALACLQHIGPSAQPHLLKLLGSADPAVRLGALQGLKRLGAPADEILEPVGRAFLNETSPEALEEEHRILSAAGPRAEPHFVGGLASPQEGVRLKALEGLRTLGSEAAIPAVAERFESDASEAVRAEARRFLESHGRKSEEVLLRALDNRNARVRLGALQALLEIRSENAFGRIAALYGTEEDPEIRGRCFDYLETVPAKAQKQLLAALGDADADLRRRAAVALGEGGVEAAIGPLIGLLGELNAPVLDAAQGALVRIGPKAVEAVAAAAAEGRVRKAQLDTIVALHHQEEVERILDALISAEGGSGSFDGQFRELRGFGREKALPTLFRMATDEGYQCRRPSPKGPADLYQRSIRELAILALGELGDKETARALGDFLRGGLVRFGDEGYDAMVVTLHRLGDPGAYGEFEKRCLRDSEDLLRGEDRERGYLLLASLGRVQNRIGRREEAGKTHLRLAKLVEDFKDQVLPVYGETLYNLACLESLAGRKDRALELLGRAVDAGFRDREWIGMDRDLEALRGEEGYKALMADGKRFENRSED